MSIIRTEHKKNYTVVNNFICTDNRLSFKAKGIWLYAFSRPDDWEFHINDLINQSTDGREAVRSGLKELEEFGYLIRNISKNEYGQFQKADWILIEKPIIKEKSTENVKPVSGLPDTENHPLLSTEKVSTEKPIVCYEAPVAPVSPNQLVVMKKNTSNEDVEVSQEEIFRLACRKKMDWTTAEIEEAWRRFAKSEGCVNDAFKMIGGIIRNMRASQTSENIVKSVKIKEDKNSIEHSPIIVVEEKKVSKEEAEKMWSSIGILPPKKD